MGVPKIDGFNLMEKAIENEASKIFQAPRHGGKAPFLFFFATQLALLHNQPVVVAPESNYKL